MWTRESISKVSIFLDTRPNRSTMLILVLVCYMSLTQIKTWVCTLVCETTTFLVQDLTISGRYYGSFLDKLHSNYQCTYSYQESFIVSNSCSYPESQELLHMSRFAQLRFSIWDFHIPLLYCGEDLIWEFMFILGILKTFGLLSILAWEMNMRLNLISILDLYI